MKKQLEITKAYQALVRLSRLILPMRDAYSIYMMLNKLEAPYQCGARLEQDIIKKLGIEIKGDRIITPSREVTTEYIEKMHDLNDMDVDIDAAPIVINMDSIGDQRISPADIKALEGFIVFQHEN